ncbi:MAG: gliding motility-associated C-terminal domain-containing protein [Bacteroidota bacterium]
MILSIKHRFFSPLLLFFCCLAALPAFAQPVNDECEGAIDIGDPTDYCSGTQGFDNRQATASGFDPATCWTDDSHDLWFKFTARFTSVTVLVNGFSGQASGGSLREPQIALYGGDCSGTINELECQRDDDRNHIIEMGQDGLIPGEEYLIRVDGMRDRRGTFELCVRNFNPPAVASSDCSTAAVLCDKSTFIVPNLEGGGLDDTELDDADCFSNGAPDITNEFNSVWFKWTCDQSGTLTFALTPLNPIDDLDFVLYELPGGLEDCDSKEVLRCMAAGENPVLFPSPCHGPTGLNTTANDVSEPAGCNQGQDNWVRQVDMEAGRSYALGINNFTESGNGIQISFGGTGTFVGPVADFTSAPADEVCYGGSVSFSDASSFELGSIVRWDWNFGIDADPASATGPGPHEVNWTSNGPKAIVLEVETNRGCVITEIKTIQVIPCCEDVNAISATAIPTDVLCFDSDDGQIDLTATSNVAITDYLWSNGSRDEDLANLNPGEYTVTISNEADCDSVFTFEVGAPPPIDIVPLITMPTCMGGTDGAIQLTVSGGTPPYAYTWDNGLPPTADQSNLSIGIYSVTVADDNDCIESLDIDVRELELVLDSDLPTVVPPSCHDASDGSITLNIANGLGPYLFDWNDGLGFVTRNSLQNINAGTYTINFRDANGCIGDTLVVVTPPDPLMTFIDPVDVSCFGAADGSAVPLVSGGVGGYQFQWSDGQTDSIASMLDVGIYTLSLTDANGCDTTAEVEIVQPDELFLDLIDVIDVVCNGDVTGSITVAGSGGNPDYEYSLDGEVYQDSALFENLAAGDYTILVRDELGCTASVDATITQPIALIVDAGQDETVELGFGTTLTAISTPLSREVTYAWTPADGLSCTDCKGPFASPVNTQTYYVLATEVGTGCTALDSVTVFVVKNRPIYVPNAFSPNGDGINEGFTVYGGPGARQIQLLRVFNRWGALVYEASNIPLNDETLGWDGRFKSKALPPDVFAFYAVVEFIDDETVLVEGDITITK